MAAAKRPAETSAPIHEHISHRWSPRAFEDKPVAPEKLRSLFEAARWAASSYGDQPWYFIVTTKVDAHNHKLALDGLVEFNQNWAKQAPVLGYSVARKKFAHKRIVDDHYFGGIGPVGPFESPPFEERHAHGAKKTGRHHAVIQNDFRLL